tara:strand:+ start:814 stop:966 length:153 start_codon:yes stop_codon:yes gene_type:complete
MDIEHNCLAYEEDGECKLCGAIITDEEISEFFSFIDPDDDFNEVLANGIN